MNKTTQDRRSGIGFGFEEFDRNDNNNGNAVDMAALMASLDAAPKQLRPGLVTKGTYLGNGFVAIAGAKFDALLHPLDRNAEPERGFEGTIVIVSNREENAKAHSDEGGTMFASFLVAKDWQALQEAKESNTPVRGKVVYKLNRRGGGFNGYKVRVGSVVGFLPASALRGVQNSQGLLNEEIDVDVVTAEPESNNLKFNLQSRANARIERYAALQVDDLVKGRVHKVLEFGVLVDIGDGCTGLLHRSEMNAGAFEGIKEDETIDVVVTRKDAKAERFSLSQRRAVRRVFAEKFVPGELRTGKVVSAQQYGVFVEIEPGVCGLLHRSRYNGTLPKVGDTLDVIVAKVDNNGDRIDLNLQG